MVNNSNRKVAARSFLKMNLHVPGKIFAAPTSFPHQMKSLRQLTESYHNLRRIHFPQQLTFEVTISKTDPQLISFPCARRLPHGPGCQRPLRSGSAYPSPLRLFQAHPSRQPRVRLGPHPLRHPSLDRAESHWD